MSYEDPFLKLPVVGTWTEAEAKDEIYHGEYAGHEETWTVQPGSCEIRLSRGRWFLARRPAVRKRYYFWNRIGAHGSATLDETPLKGTHAIQLDCFGLANAVLEGKAVLADGYHVRLIGTYSNGKPMLAVFTDEGRMVSR